MKGGRKNLMRGAEEQDLTLRDGESIVQVVSLRGSNLIEVMNACGEKLLAMIPAKFQKTIWIKRGSFVVVDESGKEGALGSGSKVACILAKVLYYEQVRTLQKSPEWPEGFKSSNIDDSNGSLQGHSSQQKRKDELDSIDDDDDDDDDDNDDALPPLEANPNRVRPFELQSAEESGSGSDTDS